MAALIVDLDGTTFTWGTNEFLPGAFESLRAFQTAGNQIIFVTRRDGVMFPLGDIQRMLRLAFPGCSIITGVDSPRIIMNDEGVASIKHPKDAAWNYDLVAMASEL